MYYYFLCIILVMIVFFIIALIFLLLSSGAGAFDYLKRNSASNSQSTEETRSQSPTTIPASTVPKCAKSDFFCDEWNPCVGDKQTCKNWKLRKNVVCNTNTGEKGGDSTTSRQCGIIPELDACIPMFGWTGDSMTPNEYCSKHDQDFKMDGSIFTDSTCSTPSSGRQPSSQAQDTLAHSFDLVTHTMLLV